MKLQVAHTTGKSTQITVSDAVFAAKVNKPLLAQAVKVYLSNQRQGAAKAQTRSEVTRSKSKWYRQKGTGGARHGSKNAPIFVGGGVAFGPDGTQNWSKKLPKSMKRSALMSALSAQVDNIMVTSVLDSIQPKTKDAVAFLKKLAPDAKRVLLVTDGSKMNIQRSTSNLQWVLTTTAQRMHVYEILLADKIIFTKEAIQALEGRLVGDQKKKVDSKVEPIKVEKKAAKVQKSKVAKTQNKKPVKKVETKTKNTVKKATKKQ